MARIHVANVQVPHPISQVCIPSITMGVLAKIDGLNSHKGLLNALF